MKGSTKSYSGYAEIPLMSNQYFNATMASYVRSFAGFLSIERDMAQPTSLLWYTDLIGVTSGETVLPNLGHENLNNINSKFQTSMSFGVGQQEYTVVTNRKLIPGSVELKFTHALEPTKYITIRDDRNGNFLAPSGILVENNGKVAEVNYRTGLITFTVGDSFTIANGDAFAVSGLEDVAGVPDFGTLTGDGKNFFKPEYRNIVVSAEPDALFVEGNLMTIAAMQKAVGTNLQDISGTKLSELYTKLVNGKLVNAIMNSFKGEPYIIDTAGFKNKFLDFNSRLDAFGSELVDIDTEMAKKSVKSVNATCYIVGTNVGNWFRKLTTGGNFVDNVGSSYINDLIGYYKGIPVLRHTDVGINDGYAIHKTTDGQLAPVMRGIFLPLTNTPLIGNPNNPTQFTNGVYYQEANVSIVPELVMKFSINAA
jgi:hypothetical protein